MPNNLSLHEASTAFLGRSNKVIVWDAIISQLTEPPRQFYASGIYNLLHESGVKVHMIDVGREINDFSKAGMITETAEHDLPPNAHVYTQAESEGWLMVNAVVESFRLWYPGMGEK